MYKSIRRIAAVLMGMVFFTAGTLKLMDPVGATLVVEEYLKFLHLGFLNGAATVLGLAFALVETLLGAALITGVWRKLTGILTGIMMLFFTLLTLILLIFNPAMDCGCFGQALHLSHAQSFAKNLVLDLLWLLAFIPMRKSGETKKIKYATFALAAISSIAFMVWSLSHLPAMDFTPFAPGAELQQAAQVGNEYLVYEKNGHEGSFSANKLPDSTWTYVRTQNVERQAFESERPLLSFCDDEGMYCDSLAAEGNVMVFSAYQPEKLGTSEWTAIEDAAALCIEHGFTPLILSTQAPSAQAEALECGYTADYRTLVALNRSNGGATFISDGMIVCKWTVKDLPADEDLAEMEKKDPVRYMLGKVSKARIRMQGYLLYVFAVMLLL